MEHPNGKGANNVLVGLFALVAMAVAFGFATFLGGSAGFFGKYVSLHSYFKDVRGLNVGAPVFLSGIQVGRVSGKTFPDAVDKKLPPPPDDKLILVSYTIEKQFLGRIKVDSEASISTVGMLGDKVIVLSPGTEASQSIQDNGLISVKSEVELSEYLAKGGNLVESLDESAKELQILLKSINQNGRFAATMANLSRVSEDLSKATGSVTEDLQPALKSLRAILAKVEKGEGTLGSLINDPSLHEDLRVLLGGAQRSTAVRFLIRQAISANEKKSEAPKTESK